MLKDYSISSILYDIARLLQFGNILLGFKLFKNYAEIHEFWTRKNIIRRIVKFSSYLTLFFMMFSWWHKFKETKQCKRKSKLE